MAFGGQVVLAHDLTGSQFRPASRQRPASVPVLSSLFTT